MEEQKIVSEYYLDLKEKISSLLNISSILDKCELDQHLYELGEKFKYIFRRENAYTIKGHLKRTKNAKNINPFFKHKRSFYSEYKNIQKKFKDHFDSIWKRDMNKFQIDFTIQKALFDSYTNFNYRIKEEDEQTKNSQLSNDFKGLKSSIDLFQDIERSQKQDDTFRQESNSNTIQDTHNKCNIKTNNTILDNSFSQNSFKSADKFLTNTSKKTFSKSLQKTNVIDPYFQITSPINKFSQKQSKTFKKCKWGQKTKVNKTVFKNNKKKTKKCNKILQINNKNIPNKENKQKNVQYTQLPQFAHLKKLSEKLEKQNKEN